MGPIADENLKIAPAFFCILTGYSWSLQHVFACQQACKIKNLDLVFGCAVTSAVDCRIMENRDTYSFIFALTNKGSQLVGECKNMIISFPGIANKLFTE